MVTMAISANAVVARVASSERTTWFGPLSLFVLCPVQILTLEEAKSFLTDAQVEYDTDDSDTSIIKRANKMKKKRALAQSDDACMAEKKMGLKDMTVKEVQAYLSKLPADKEQVWLTMIGIIADIPYVDVRLKHNTQGKGCRGLIDGDECIKCHEKNILGTPGYSFDIVLHDPKTGDKNTVQVKGADAAGACLFACTAEQFRALDKDARDDKIVNVIADKFRFTICVMNANTPSPGAVVTRAARYVEGAGSSSADATTPVTDKKPKRPRRSAPADNNQ